MKIKIIKYGTMTFKVIKKCKSNKIKDENGTIVKRFDKNELVAYKCQNIETLEECVILVSKKDEKIIVKEELL